MHTQERNQSAAEKLYLRIGFQAGPVLQEHNDLFGDTVNTAARVAAEAFRERILTTRATVDMFPREFAAVPRSWRSAALKGKDVTVDLMELIWRDGGTQVRHKTTCGHSREQNFTSISRPARSRVP